MTDDARIIVMSGVHEGASAALPDGHELAIGSGQEADLILVDEGVAPRHVSVRLRDGKLVLRALHEDVAIFGTPLKAGAHTAMLYGGWFSIGTVTLQFASEGLPDAASTRHAELAWLLRHAPLTWLARRWAYAPRAVRLTLAAMPIAAALWHGWQLFAPQAPDRASTTLDHPAFRNVRVHKDAANGIRTYEGYVQSTGDLAALAVAARTDGGQYTMRVSVIDVMQEQLSDLLVRFYRGASVQARAQTPGTFVVTLPGEEGYLQPDSWDYARVARNACAQVDGVRKVEFAGHENDAGPARMPLGALNLNLLHSPHAYWLSDPQGARYFAGARIAIGRIVRISPGIATVERDDGTILELYTSHDTE